MLSTHGHHIHEIYQDFIKITDTVAREIFELSGKGNKFEADKRAVETMQRMLEELPYKITLLIGEGEKENSATIEKGKKFGLTLKEKMELEIVVDPLECTSNFVKGLPDSMSILMVAEKGIIQNVPSTYMKQLLLPREVKEVAKLILNKDMDPPQKTKDIFQKYFYFDEALDSRGKIFKINKEIIEASPEELIYMVAYSKKLDISDITVVIQDRPRHTDIIKEVRKLGAGIALIDSGSISASADILLQKDGRNNFLMGTYGAPQGLFVSFMAKSSNSIFVGKIEPHSEKAEKEAIEMQLIDKIYDQDEWVRGEAIITMSGIHSSTWLPGVKRILKKQKNETTKNFDTKPYRYLVSTVVWTVNSVILVECENGDIRSKRVIFR